MRVRQLIFLNFLLLTSFVCLAANQKKGAKPATTLVFTSSQAREVCKNTLSKYTAEKHLKKCQADLIKNPRATLKRLQGISKAAR
jgi:hypothetical protein